MSSKAVTCEGIEESKEMPKIENLITRYELRQEISNHVVCVIRKAADQV